MCTGRTGEIRAAQIFVAVRGASSPTHAEASWTQTLPDWIGSHLRALAFMGDAPAQLAPTTQRGCPAKAEVGVTRANWCAPGLNRNDLNLATHYRTAILPVWPRKPRDTPEHMPSPTGATPSRPSSGSAVRRRRSAPPHPEQGYRACIRHSGILRLGRQYGADRVEAACDRGLDIGARSYGSIQSILKHGLDKQPARAARQGELLPDHPNIRGSRYGH